MRSIAAFAIVIRPRWEDDAACTSGYDDPRALRVASDGLGDFAGLETTRAHIGARRLAVDDGADVLEVRVEAPLRGDHGVAPVVPEPGLLPADGADLRHRRASVATTRLLPWR